jgi:DNA repair protein RadC
MSEESASMSNTLALLDRLKKEIPDISGQTRVVGQWVWVEFNVPPLQGIRIKLKELGFHWNRKRKCWQHPCGTSRTSAKAETHASDKVSPTGAAELKDAPSVAKEYKVIALRECLLPDSLRECDTPDKAAEYWQLHVTTNPYFNPECECFLVLLLTTRRRVKGHHLVSIGTIDTILVHPREVFRIAVIASAAAVVLMHNHPSGDPTPSEADVKVTRDLIRAGQLMKIEVLDHVIMGNPRRSSLRELGYFYS